MVSRTAAEQAIRKHAQRSTLKGLLAFLHKQSDDELSQWSIRDVDGDEAIFAYFRLRAAKYGDMSADTDQCDQQVASVAAWWPACWLKSVVPMWQVREDEGSRQQQHRNATGACTMPATAAPHSASVNDTHTPAATSPGPSPSPSCFQPPPSQHLSACRQRRPQRAGPQQALGSCCC